MSRCIAGLLVLALAAGHGRVAPATSGASVPWLWGSLRPGPYGVGIHVIAGSDSSRPEPTAPTGARARPLELLVWYPTDHPGLTRDPIPFATYVDLSGGPMRSAVAGKSDDWRRRWLAESVSREPSSVPAGLLDRVLTSRMAAVADAPPARVRQPVILWSTRHATPAAQSVLSEYLASFGYVVAWEHYVGSDSLPPPYDDVSPQRKAEVLEAHVRDMQWALAELARRPDVDSMRTGVAAWSYSGEPATVLVQRNPRVRVLVSLSSNIFVPTYRAVSMGASLDSLPLRSDVVMLEQTGDAGGQPRTAPPFLDSLPGKVYRATFPALAHGNFNVLEGMIPGLTSIAAVQPWSSGGVQARTGYERICRVVRTLLDKMLKGAPTFDSLPAAVTITRYGPGRTASSTRGTTFADRRLTIQSDGWRLVGNMVEPTDGARVPAVLMLNKANGDRRVYTDLARELALRGVASLRLDMRGHGESTNRGTFVPGLTNVAMDHPEHDVQAALHGMNADPRIDAARIGVLGASWTGEAMAVAERAGSGARAYVALSPGSLSSETIDQIDRSGAPWWIIASREERFLREVIAAVRARSRTARVTELAGKAHASDMLPANPDLAHEIADWFATELRR